MIGSLLVFRRSSEANAVRSPVNEPPPVITKLPPEYVRWLPVLSVWVLVPALLVSANTKNPFELLDCVVLT